MAGEVAWEACVPAANTHPTPQPLLDKSRVHLPIWGALGPSWRWDREGMGADTPGGTSTPPARVAPRIPGQKISGETPPFLPYGGFQVLLEGFPNYSEKAGVPDR